MGSAATNETSMATPWDTRIGILDALEEHETGFDAADLAQARAQIRARTLRLQAGANALSDALSDERGVLVLKGFMLREAAIDQHPNAELIGPGDVLLADVQPRGLIACRVSWRVLAETHLAVLDAELMAQLRAWPALEWSLLRRTTDRAERSSLERAMLAVPSIELRIVLFLWHYATRWGRVTTDGLLVPVEMTHETLGLLVGARRPTVTKAVSRLRTRGAIEQRGNRTWLLRARDAEALSQLAFPAGSPDSTQPLKSPPQALTSESLATRLAEQRARLMHVRERHEAALALMRKRADQLAVGAVRLQAGMSAVRERACDPS